MPWHAVKNHHDCPSDTPHAVVKDDTGEKVSCHATMDDAEAAVRAMYANEDDMHSDQASTTTLATETQIEVETDTSPLPAWQGVLVVEGIPTGDGRQFAENALTWPELPIPLRWNKEDSHGGDVHTVAVNVGRIDRIWREGSSIHGAGIFNLDEEDGKRAYELVRGGFLSGISIDADSITDADMELVWPDSGADEADDDDDGADLFDLLFGMPELVIFHAGRIRAATLVDIPAFVEASIKLTDQDPSTLELTDNASEASERTEPIVAHGGLDYQPPRHWFDDPKLSVPTPITVDDAGRIYGHAALWGECHIGHPNTCVTPPREGDHPYFMTGELVCDDRSHVAVGQITLGTRHAALNLDPTRAAEHYEHTGVAVADVAVGEDGSGIWVAGAIRPGVPDARIRELRASGQVSGDWRRIGGKLRLVGLLAVNVPGFPVPRMSARVADDVQVALVAAGRTTVGHGDLTPMYEQQALRKMMRLLAERVHRGEA